MGMSEVKNIVEKLKKRKAAEEDGVPNEVWKYVGGRMEEWCGVSVAGYGEGKNGRNSGGTK